MSQDSKVLLPAPGLDSWRAGAVALLALMTPEGQRAALAQWKALDFVPALPAAPVAQLQTTGLLADFTVIDLEFSGTDLLELAAIRYQHWQPVGEVQSLVRFRGPVSSWITNLTGITPARLYNAADEKTVLQRFKHLAEDSVLVCHNISADRRVLEAARTRQGATTPLPNRWLCTLALAKLRLPKGQKCGLGDLCTLFSIDNRGAHQALRDVQMCYQVLRHLHAQEPITELVTSTAKPKNAGTGVLFATAA
jgi:DNA polymerase-3 subunit epsilon